MVSEQTRQAGTRGHRYESWHCRIPAAYFSKMTKLFSAITDSMGEPSGMTEATTTTNDAVTLTNNATEITSENSTEVPKGDPTTNAPTVNLSSTTRSTTTTTQPIVVTINSTDSMPDYVRLCPSNVECQKLGSDCVTCDFETNCHYGRNVSTTCWPKNLIECTVSRPRHGRADPASFNGIL